MNYKIIFNDRTYTQWTLQNECSGVLINGNGSHYCLDGELIDISKLFSGEIFYIDNEIKKPVIIISPVRDGFVHTGVLLCNGKTYGKTKNGRLLYQCIPTDKHLPSFLIPYDVKIGFSKKVINIYVLFIYQSWNDKHPQGILRQNLGGVDDLNSYYDYLLYSKNLFRKKAGKSITDVVNDDVVVDDDNVNEFIFTMDAKTTKDYDDAFQFRELNGIICVSIYITNVANLLQKCGIEWTKTEYLQPSIALVSNIYLPNRRLTIFPNEICATTSLISDGKRHGCMVCHFYYTIAGEFIRYEWKSLVDIFISANLSYNDINNDVVAKMLEFTRSLNKTILDTKKMVAFWMRQYNIYGGFYINNCSNGSNDDDIGAAFFRKEPVMFASTWEMLQERCLMGSENNLCDKNKYFYSKYTGGYYLSLSSPMRKMIDLLNQVILMNYSADLKVKEWIIKWKYALDYLNNSLINIAKIQRDCWLLHNVCSREKAEKYIEEGIIFSCYLLDDGKYIYSVYFKFLLLFTQIKLQKKINNGDSFPFVCSFQLFYFKDEFDVKKKVKIIINTDGIC